MKKVLIANRGEIALRVIRTCRELGLKTVAVYSTADRDSLHVRFADEAVCIGPPPSRESYLMPDRIIAAATVTGADAVHPGYGFLSENAAFAQICEEHGLTFIGPSPEVIVKMGDKATAKDTMRAAGVPVVPGSDGIVEDEDEALKVAREIGFPVIVKASAGGGGRGMRVVEKEEDFGRHFNAARSEAEAAFGNGAVYVEKFVTKPRHIEIQLLGDGETVLAYGERECSIQRRHQKLLEEAPSPVLTPDLRRRMCEAAIKGAESVGYKGAGTIEFLVDGNLDFYFMEMNTRIQVEHPVTEEVTNTDLIEQQLLVAMGEKLSPMPDGSKLVPIEGHAIECRINAEDPFKFTPSPGRVTHWHMPGGPGVRVDSHVYNNYFVPPNYDSMIGKIIVYGDTRAQAIARMQTALAEMAVEGISTNVPLHRELMVDAKFIEGGTNIHYLEKWLDERRR